MKFLEKDIINALDVTRSMSEAARYLNINRKTLYRYMDILQISRDKYNNKAGFGIPKGAIHGRYKISDIILGTYNGYKFNANAIKSKLILELILPEECCQCGFNERRITDHKVPLLLDFKDDNATNYMRENLCLMCYNCAFLHGRSRAGRKRYVNVLINPYTQEFIDEVAL